MKLRIAGGQTADDKKYIRKIKRKLIRHKLDQDVEFLLNLNREEKIEFLKSLTVLSVPAVHREAFGTYLLEAMAAGVPVVQPDHGAFTELLKITGGGILCEPDNVEALAQALEELITNPDKATQLGSAGRKSVFEKFGTHQMADAFIKALDTTIT